MLLEVKDLVIEFHDHETPERVVEHVSFSLDEGEILGLVGESGSGKSMTSHAIAGLLPRKKLNKYGEILFEGGDVLRMKREKLRKLQGKEIGVIFQEPMSSLNPTMRIGMQVEEALRIHTNQTPEERKKTALEWLRNVELNDPERVYDAYPHELSGGMRQRVMIAAAMVTAPKLLIADEPTSALDVTVQAQIVELLLRINRETKVAIIFISHDLSLVRQISHNVMVMKQGRIVEQGDVDALFQAPKEDYTQELIRAIPKVDLAKPRRVEDKTDRPVVAGMEDVSVAFGDQKVLQNITFAIHEGEILGLAGESGSGKTTIAKTILGMAKAQSGKIGALPAAQMVFQDPYGSLNMAKTVGWIMQEPLRLQTSDKRAVREQKVLEMLDDIGLERGVKDRRPNQLSGGQRQRVSIGTALMQSPALLIADEPVSALDVTIQAQILALMKRLHEEKNLTILFISHDLRTMYDFCDRIMILKDGHIVEEGAPDVLYTAPKEPYTRALLRAAGIM